ncbi:patatin family protein [Weizmannia acidilactici]|uniref:Patatin family protein n=1 Tax=Weizmannia acidilactici TaxID=2607726 RepID=A0A5J4JG73_9BACI|nr:patatin family protein [Weizmannia acidilactici]GER71073.1 patatin family protein [Weizmannia acidilactici]GER74544.1 patatin family protein [Weizmannia acidilactici]
MLLNCGLVLEGGGMRGVYTAGVLESFLEHGIEFPYVIGVSAGACNAASFLSKQKGRNRKVNIDFIHEERYLSWKNYIRNRELFGMDYVFDEIPKKHVPFDFQAFDENPCEFVIGTTDCMTGKPVYFTRKDYKGNLLQVLRASSSLPLAAPIVEIGGRPLLDGGLSDPIPIKKAIQDGFTYNIVISTRNRGYRKKPAKFTFFIKRKYRAYPGVYEAVKKRAGLYNETVEFIENEEREGRVFLICPQEPLKVKRIEKNAKRLTELYEQGVRDGGRIMEQLISWDTRLKTHMKARVR